MARPSAMVEQEQPSVELRAVQVPGMSRRVGQRKSSKELVPGREKASLTGLKLRSNGFTAY